MLVVLPFCEVDRHLAVRVLDWCCAMEDKVPFQCILAHDRGEPARDVMDRAVRYFDKVAEWNFSRWLGPREWPYPQNHAFQECASLLYQECHRGVMAPEPWLWWEPDATPLRPGWLQAIAAEHVKGGKFWTGHLVTLSNPVVSQHMTGCGVYPWDMAVRSLNAMTTTRIAFDSAMWKDVKESFHSMNHIFQHTYREESTDAPVTFPDDASVDEKVAPEAYLFHRCKDGTLLDRLFERLEGKPTVVELDRQIDKALTKGERVPKRHPYVKRKKLTPEAERIATLERQLAEVTSLLRSNAKPVRKDTPTSASQNDALGQWDVCDSRAPQSKFEAPPA